MSTIRSIADLLEAHFPSRLAEEWDNVGLLIGDPDRPVRRIMTCLTITRDSADEALSRSADLIVTHHPLLFRPVSRLTTESPEGRLIYSLIDGNVAVYSPHTAFDSAAAGINQQLAEGLGLTNIRPLVPGEMELGGGRFGQLESILPFDEVAGRIKEFLGVSQLQVVGPPEHPVHLIAVACGSGGEFLDAADAADCDLLVTGEARFHTCLAAESLDMTLILAGHYASERFALDWLAGWLAKQLPDLEIWASAAERDPIRLV